MIEDRIPRRTLLKSALLGLAAIPASAMIGEAMAGAPPALVPIDGNDPAAKALGYAADSSKVDAKANPTHKPEQKCVTCVQFQGKAGDARGGCNLFPGKSVAGEGWCKVWALKPAMPKPA
jgi:High potential iron-sulfur protein